MKGADRARRAFLIYSMAAAGIACWAQRAFALDVPAGEVILTITGELTHPNDGAAASFDLALLRSLPPHSFSTSTPWFPQPRKFTGVLFGDLLAAVGSPANRLHAVALNDYRVDIPVADMVENGAMLAYLLDDQPVAVRDKGPLFIIYPFAANPGLRTAVRYSRAVWQLRSIELQ